MARVPLHWTSPAAEQAPRPFGLGPKTHPATDRGLPAEDGLEFVEKLLTDSILALQDGAEREHATRVPHRRIAGRPRYCSSLSVAEAFDA
jgi:hypothetical protein